MATLKLTLVKAKALKDGRQKIRVAVCHKHETCYMVTNVILDSDTQFRNGRVVRRPDAAALNKRLRNLLDEYQERLDAIADPTLYDCSRLRDMLSDSDKPADPSTFRGMSLSYVRELEENGSVGYSRLMERNSRYFTEFSKGDIPLADITPDLIEGYSRFLRVRKRVGEATNGMMMRMTKTIINRGIKRRMVRYETHPFLGFRIASSPVREVDLSLPAFTKLKDSNPPERRYRMARDLFLLSFYLGGINLIDLLGIDFRKETVEYVRTKSRNTTQGVRTISFTIPPEAREVAKVWMNRRTGRLDLGYKFSYPNLSRYITRCLARLALSLGITEKVIFYSARKSFAQYASEIGIPDGVIDYCLGHSDKSKGVIRYYTKVRRRQADMAISRVIDYVNDPEKYSDYIEMRKDIMMMRG